MAIEKKERYIIHFTDGTGKTVVASTYQEVIAMFGEENIESIAKKDYEEVK